MATPVHLLRLTEEERIFLFSLVETYYNPLAETSQITMITTLRQKLNLGPPRQILSYLQWTEMYKPMQNVTVSDGEAPFDGCLYDLSETQWGSVHEIFHKDDHYVWTVQRLRDGTLMIYPGLLTHSCQETPALGHIICEVAWKDEDRVHLAVLAECPVQGDRWLLIYLLGQEIEVRGPYETDEEREQAILSLYAEQPARRLLALNVLPGTTPELRFV